MKKLFRASENYPDGSRIYYIHRETIRYQESDGRYISFDIGFDRRQYVTIVDDLYWDGASVEKIGTDKINEIKRKIKFYFASRGVDFDVK